MVICLHVCNRDLTLHTKVHSYNDFRVFSQKHLNVRYLVTDNKDLMKTEYINLDGTH